MEKRDGETRTKSHSPAKYAEILGATLVRAFALMTLVLLLAPYLVVHGLLVSRGQGQ